MSGKEDTSGRSDSDRPFGSRRDLPGAWLYLLCTLYAAWFIALIWMAVSESAR